MAPRIIGTEIQSELMPDLTLALLRLTHITPYHYLGLTIVCFFAYAS